MDIRQNIVQKTCFLDWFIPTSSVMFRKNRLKKIPDWLLAVKNGDLSLYLILSKYGSLDYVSEKMSVYRMHNQGISSSISRKEQFQNLIYLLLKINNELSGQLDLDISKFTDKLYDFIISEKKLAEKNNYKQ
jgi:hypothetical protein